MSEQHAPCGRCRGCGQFKPVMLFDFKLLCGNCEEGMSTNAKPKLSNAEFVKKAERFMRSLDDVLIEGAVKIAFAEALDRLEAAEAENWQKDLLLTFGTEQMARAHADFAQLKAENAELRAAVAELDKVTDFKVKVRAILLQLEELSFDSPHWHIGLAPIETRREMADKWIEINSLLQETEVPHE